MYSISYLSVHLIFLRLQLHSAFISLFLLTTIFHSFHNICHMFYSRDHKPKSLKGVGSWPMPASYTSWAVVSLWWTEEAVPTHPPRPPQPPRCLRQQMSGSKQLPCGNAGLVISIFWFFFFIKINNPELHAKLTFEILGSNHNT